MAPEQTSAPAGHARLLNYLAASFCIPACIDYSRVLRINCFYLWPPRLRQSRLASGRAPFRFNAFLTFLAHRIGRQRKLKRLVPLHISAPLLAAQTGTCLMVKVGIRGERLTLEKMKGNLHLTPRLG